MSRRWAGLYELPEVDKGIRSFKVMRALLRAKSYALVYVASQKEDPVPQWEGALQAFEVFFDVLQAEINSFTTFRSKQWLRGRYRAEFDYALYLCNKLYKATGDATYLERALQHRSGLGAFCC